jgi:isocitrate/isopropylmalate dehydrogenase
MLAYLGCSAEAQAIEDAVRAAIREGKTTTDLGGSLNTRQVGDWLAAKVVSA